MSEADESDTRRGARQDAAPSTLQSFSIADSEESNESLLELKVDVEPATDSIPEELQPEVRFKRQSTHSLE